MWAVPRAGAEARPSSWVSREGWGPHSAVPPRGCSPAAPGAASPALLSPFRWLPSVPRRAEEPSEDFALRVQEVGERGGWGSGLLRFGMVPESGEEDLPRALLDECIYMMGTLAPIYCPLFFPWPVCDPPIYPPACYQGSPSPSSPNLSLPVHNTTNQIKQLFLHLSLMCWHFIAPVPKISYLPVSLFWQDALAYPGPSCAPGNAEMHH